VGQYTFIDKSGLKNSQTLKENKNNVFLSESKVNRNQPNLYW